MKFPRKSIYRIAISIASFILIIFLLNFYQKEVKNFFYKISEPIQKFLWRVGDRVSDFFETITKINKLKKEADELLLKNQELMAEIVSLKELKKENEILREALEIGLKKDFKLIFAQVIGKDVSQDSILIDQGSKDGIRKGLPVISQQKTLVGEISQVYENFSKVMLISNRESSFDAKIPDTEIYGVVKGKGNFKLYFDLIPKDQEIREGDLLVTSALGGVFPPGLLIGEVKEVKKSDVELFQKAEIKPAFDIKELKFLFVVREW